MKKVLKQVLGNIRKGERGREMAERDKREIVHWLKREGEERQQDGGKVKKKRKDTKEGS